MTLSQRARREDRLRALVLMLDHLGQDRHYDRFFDIAAGPFNAIQPTTWRELEQQGLTKGAKDSSGARYRLTPKGWLEAMRQRGDLDQAGLPAKVSAIAAAVRQKVDRRSQHDTFIDPGDLAAATGLPVGWVYNALAAQLLECLYPTKMMQVTLHPSERYFSVAPTFGMERPRA